MKPLIFRDAGWDIKGIRELGISFRGYKFNMDHDFPMLLLNLYRASITEEAI